jgi:hypothetical protein
LKLWPTNCRWRWCRSFVQGNGKDFGWASERIWRILSLLGEGRISQRGREAEEANKQEISKWASLNEMTKWMKREEGDNEERDKQDS